jgi:hypothetical protein
VGYENIYKGKFKPHNRAEASLCLTKTLDPDMLQSLPSKITACRFKMPFKPSAISGAEASAMVLT